MPHIPQRPFVPHPTPMSGRPAIRASEFRLYTPFVPGTVRETVDVPAAFDPTAASQARSDASVLRPIEDFLETSPSRTPAYQQPEEDLPDVGAFDEESDELPPVEHFIDPAPGMDPFGTGAEPGLTESAAMAAQEPGESGWGETDWQTYDWRAAAALGDTPNNEASSAWASTDWEGNVPRARELRRSAAHAIATALDEIAQRIRAGEQVVPGSGALDPANIAATLAALLGIKR